MSDVIKTMEPQYNVTNIPHSLRVMAGDIEAGRAGPYDSVVVLTLNEGDSLSLFEFGKESDRMRLVGALQMAVQFVGRIEDDA